MRGCGFGRNFRGHHIVGLVRRLVPDALQAPLHAVGVGLNRSLAMST